MLNALSIITILFVSFQYTTRVLCFFFMSLNFWKEVHNYEHSLLFCMQWLTDSKGWSLKIYIKKWKKIERSKWRTFHIIVPYMLYCSSKLLKIFVFFKYTFFLLRFEFQCYGTFKTIREKIGKKCALDQLFTIHILL